MGFSENDLREMLAERGGSEPAPDLVATIERRGRRVRRRRRATVTVATAVVIVGGAVPFVVRGGEPAQTRVAAAPSTPAPTSTPTSGAEPVCSITLRVTDQAGKLVLTVVSTTQAFEACRSASRERGCRVLLDGKVKDSRLRPMKIRLVRAEMKGTVLKCEGRAERR
ncbi:hypothetical protein [Spirillospora sp. NPDC047279]|uniref:hypothetical protein n=1 Tax=Spirillospora sp. NPDC047279 TaxID=3155478 RepID=UPI0033EE4B62